MVVRDRPPIQPPVFRIRWFMLGGIVLLSLLVGGVVLAARSSQGYVCLQLTNGFGGGAQQFDLVDLQSGQDALDTRVGQSPFGFASPDGQYSAALQVSKPGSSIDNLVIQHSGKGSKGSTEAVTVQGDITSGTAGYGRFGNMRWSPDSKRLAYLWTDVDQKTHLSAVNADGSGLTSVILPDTSGSTVNRQISWSADGVYLSLGETANRSDMTYSFWSGADLGRVETNQQVTVSAVTWAPQGHQLAAVWEETNGTRHVALWTLSGQAVDTSLAMPPDKTVGQIVWSPDGQYVVVQTDQQCSPTEGCTDRLNYNVLRRDGQVIAADVAGEASASSNQNYFYGTPSVFTWSADGQSLIFLQEHPETSIDNLVALHMPSSQVEIIAHNVVSDLAHEMFSVGFPFRRQGFARGGAATPIGGRVVLPTWENGKVTVELADSDGSHRVMLVQGADEILDARAGSRGYTSRFWTASGKIAVVVWATGKADDNTRRVHVTWAQADGSGKHEIDDGLESVGAVQYIQGMGQQWLGYVAERDGKYGIELANIATGKSSLLLGGLDSVNQWALTPSPVGDLLALQVGATSGSLYGENTLFLMKLDGTGIHQVSAQIMGNVAWSPDGSKLAFVHRDSSGSDAYVQVIGADGQPAQDILIRQASNTSPRLYRWSQCS